MPKVNAQHAPYTLGCAESTWAAEEGQDFIADHNSTNIDFATIHSWPDNWKVNLMSLQSCQGLCVAVLHDSI